MTHEKGREGINLTIEKGIKQKSLRDISHILNNWKSEKKDTEAIGKYYNFDQIKELRSSLAIISPYEQTNADPYILNMIIEENNIWENKGNDIYLYAENAKHIKTSFPRQYQSIYNHIERDFIVEELLLDFKEAKEENNRYEMYNIAKDIKIIIGEDEFRHIDLLNMFGQNGWEEFLIKDFRNTNNLKSYGCEILTDFLASTNIINFPRKIYPSDNIWAKFLEHIYTFQSNEGTDYPNLARYISKLHIISAKNVKITEQNINLIF